MIETEYQKALLKALAVDAVRHRMLAGARPVHWFGRVTGKFELAKGGWVHPSIPGQCDLYGIRERDARHFEVELKNVHTPTSAEQVAWAVLCELRGWPHREIRVQARESPAATIERWVKELREWTQGIA